MTMQTLTRLLPEPKHHDDRVPSSLLLDIASSLEARIVKKVSGVPPYGQRCGWIPRTLEVFGDGGAFPEISIAQYPREMIALL
jgi:SNW domain-containing protein 1